MRKEPLSLTVDPAIRATFQAQLAEAREIPGSSVAGHASCAGSLSPLFRLLPAAESATAPGPARFAASMEALTVCSCSAPGLGGAPVLAATINVDGTNCTLADAIRSANTDAAVGGCTKGSGADTLVPRPEEHPHAHHGRGHDLWGHRPAAGHEHHHDFWPQEHD